MQVENHFSGERVEFYSSGVVNHQSDEIINGECPIILYFSEIASLSIDLWRAYMAEKDRSGTAARVQRSDVIGLL